MANISRIIDCQISLNTAGVSSMGFSTLMVVGPHAYTADRVLSVGSSDELLELGFKSDDAIYIAVNDALSQTPRPKQVKVGRFQCDSVRLSMVGTASAGVVFSATITIVDEKGVSATETVSYNAIGDDTTDVVLKGLASSMSGSSAFKASVSEEQLVIKANDPNLNFGIEVNSNLKIYSFEPVVSSVADNMALICATDDDFYGIVYVSRKPEDIISMADWCESHTKLYGTAISEEGCKNGGVSTDTGSKLMNGNYFRTFWYYHANADTDYPEAAIMARCFAVYPGGETWANKRLGGIITDKLKENEYQAITKKNGNTFEPFRNLSITQNGKVAAGEWIDVIRFRDWLVETIQTEEFTMLINRDKLPYTDSGIAMAESVLEKVLALGQKRGGIAPTEYDAEGNKNVGYYISVPLASEISANVKSQRVLQDVSFTARLAGAIHAVEIKGSLTYENLIVK